MAGELGGFDEAIHAAEVMSGECAGEVEQGIRDDLVPFGGAGHILSHERVMHGLGDDPRDDSGDVLAIRPGVLPAVHGSGTPFEHPERTSEANWLGWHLSYL